MNKINAVVSFALGCLFVSAVAWANPHLLERSFDVEPGGTLYIDSDSGKIEIVSHRENSLEVEIVTGGRDADEFEFSFEHEGSDVTIKGKKKSSWSSNWLNFGSTIKYLVKVPSSYNLDLKTGGGSIEVSDLTGELKAKTSGGSISLGQIDGDVDVATSGGSIRVEEVAGSIQARTSGGSIRVEVSAPITQDSKLTTSGGSITAYLIESAAFDLDARTSGGRVKTDFDVKGRIKRTSIKGEVNGGGPLLELATSGGSVSIKEI